MFHSNRSTPLFLTKWMNNTLHLRTKYFTLKTFNNFRIFSVIKLTDTGTCIWLWFIHLAYNDCLLKIIGNNLKGRGYWLKDEGKLKKKSYCLPPANTNVFFNNLYASLVTAPNLMGTQDTRVKLCQGNSCKRDFCNLVLFQYTAKGL